MLDGFFSGSAFNIGLTDKQKLEKRIQESVYDLIIDRDQSFLQTARKFNTNFIINKRDGGIQHFKALGRNYVSFPSSFESKLKEMEEAGIDVETEFTNLINACSVIDGDIDTANNIYDLEESNFSEKSLEWKKNEYKKITGNELSIHDDFKDVFEYRESNDEPNKDDEDDITEGEEGSSGTALTNTGIEESSSSDQELKYEYTGEERSREYNFEDTDLNISDSLPKDFPKNVFMDCQYYEDINIKLKKEEPHLKALANQIAKSFKGRISRLNTVAPSKRLNTKALTSDVSEKIYRNKKGENGKFLNVNLVIDMSGSMGGTPVENALKMVYIFNEIANQGYLEGSVIWSQSNGSCKVDFPMPRDFILRMNAVNNGEGLGKNMEKYKDVLKSSDSNICMTDGNLCDDPILKSMYEKEKIEVIGVYVNKDAEDLTEYTGSLNRWFTKSIVRRNIDELAEKLIQFSLRRKK